MTSQSQEALETLLGLDTKHVYKAVEWIFGENNIRKLSDGTEEGGWKVLLLFEVG